MSFAEYSIKNKVISWMFVLILLIGGGISFTKLGQLEFPEFTIKQAAIVTNYPGASPTQVEEEVTLPLENALQQLGNIKNLTSVSSAGLSQIVIEMSEHVPSHQLPQVWDELRRKIRDEQENLPPGVRTPTVFDDFGDVFGIFLTLTGDGFDYRELENYAKFLQRDLVLIDGVKKVNIAGVPSEQIVVEADNAKVTAVGMSPDTVSAILSNQNVVSNAGSVIAGNERVRIHPTGEWDGVEDLRQLLVNQPGKANLVRLGDIADIKRVFKEKPRNLYHTAGQASLSLGISFASGVNVVDVGKAVAARIAELDSMRPLGMEIATLYNQSEIVETAVSGFLINLAESVGIVIVVLLLFMGVRSGVLMGVILLLTILGTFIVMLIFDIQLQIISLGALIIALGMLVDNAIVITEGILIGLQRGQTKLEAAKNVVWQTQWPLLGATVIAVVAFAPIGLSPDSVGEFCVSLFQVLCISLLISWITAITLTPFLADLWFTESKLGDSKATADPYQGAFFAGYRWLLDKAMHHRFLTILLVAAMLVLAVGNFSKVKNVFFPPSNTPIFFVDVWLKEGNDIRSTERFVTRLENDMLADERVEAVVSTIGQGGVRFVLPYAVEKTYAAYAQLIVRMGDLDAILAYLPVLDAHLKQHYPEAFFRIKRMENGPSPAAKIEARFSGEDPAVLRQLADQAIQVLRQEPTAVNIRHDWRNQVLVTRPALIEARAREAGITKSALDDALLTNFEGYKVGTYREGSRVLPIILRAPDQERLSIDSMSSLSVWSPERGVYVPITQVVANFDSEWENPLIMRRDRKRTLSVLADPDMFSDETADSVFRKVRAGIEAIPLPAGYHLEWGGEYESARDAQSNIFASLPLGYLFMFLITVFLFNSVRKSLSIWFNIPLVMIGVTSGLLLLNAPFSFMALLGLLSLSGMVIKNGIVLVDQISAELDEGKAPYEAVFHASVSRVRPVAMAAITTMLGMIPLFFDAFFSSMAVTIVFGLGFATVLTLIVLPVTYCLLFRIPHKVWDEAAGQH